MNELSKSLPEDYGAVLALLKQRIRDAQNEALRVVNRQLVFALLGHRCNNRSATRGRFVGQIGGADGWPMICKRNSPGIRGFSRAKPVAICVQFYLESYRES